MCICTFLGPKGAECLVSLGRLYVECYFATWEPSSELNAALRYSPMHVRSTCMKRFEMNDTHLQLIKLTEPVLSLLPKSIYELRVPFRSPVEGAWCRSAVSQHWTHRVKEKMSVLALKGVHRTDHVRDSLIATWLPAIRGIYTTRCLSKTKHVTEDSSHPALALFSFREFLPQYCKTVYHTTHWL